MIIDVSYSQGKIDFNKLSKEKELQGIIIRAGYGKNNIDTQFQHNIVQATKHKMKIGIYWFSYAYTVDMARKEASYCLDAIKGYDIKLPIFFDWEYDSEVYARKNGVKPNRALITDMNKAFCDVVEKHGYVAGYYSNLDFEQSKLNVNELKKYVKWYAQYSTKASKDYDLWQYSSKAKLAGITANTVDANKPSAEFTKKFLSDKLKVPKAPLNYKDTGNEVKELQQCLNKTLNLHLKVDGIYGNLTAEAVAKFKEKYKLSSYNGKHYGNIMKAKLETLIK